jgi:4,5-dihydroxyphthalate decarboxylase
MREGWMGKLRMTLAHSMNDRSRPVLDGSVAPDGIEFQPMVVRRSIYEQHPWVALNIFNAYRLAKEQVAARVRELLAAHPELGLLPSTAREALRVDPYPYGVRSNRKLLETATAYSHDQGLTPRVVGLDEVFAARTHDL